MLNIRGVRGWIHFRDQPIRTKFLSVMILEGSLALLLAGVALLGYEREQYCRDAARQLSVLARVVAASSSAAASFADRGAASKTLSALSHNPGVLYAAIYDVHRRQLASIGQSNGAPVAIGATHHKFGVPAVEGDSMVLLQPIVLDQEQVGTLAIRFDLGWIAGRLQRYLGALLAILLASFLLALAFGSRLLRVITGPIASLATAAHRVSQEKDYSVRAIKQGNDELGMLVDAFNEMLSQIEVHDRARLSAERSLRDSEERYALAAHGANDGLWDWNLVTQGIYFSSRWKGILGYAEDEFQNDPEEWFRHIHPADRERVRNEIQAHWDGTASEFSSEHRIRHKNGSYVWVLSRGLAVRDANLRPVRMAGSQTDITAGKVADPLTELPNRVFLLDRLTVAAEIARQQPDYRFALLFLDLDRFKLINDSMGHAAGDQLLMEIAARLRSSVQVPESGATGSVVTRLGGDEFGVLLEPIRGEQDATGVAAQILQALSTPFQLEGQQMFANVSIGIALNTPGETQADLLRNADTAMYQAKARGRGCFAVFDNSMREEAMARMQAESDLRVAIASQQFVIHYQPRVCLQTRQLAGFEALVRWRHPDRGLIHPGDFISIAEETGLIIPIGRWVLLEACRQLAEWQQEQSAAKSLSVSVNVSFRELVQPDFTEDVAQILLITGLPPECLCLEMTESSVMENAEAAVASLTRLKEMNIGLEIDDFGTGYSSLSYLHHLPFDMLKVDRTFVRELGTGADSAEIVSTILKLAHSLGMQAVAEGIETQQHLDELLELGCSYGQGFYFSKPLDPAAAECLLCSPEWIDKGLQPLQTALSGVG